LDRGTVHQQERKTADGEIGYRAPDCKTEKGPKPQGRWAGR